MAGYMGDRYPVFDHNYDVGRAEVRVQQLLPKNPFACPIWELRRDAARFEAGREHMESQVDDSLTLFGQMFPPEMSLNANANHYFALAHKMAMPEKTRALYDAAADPAVKLASLEEVARNLIFAAHLWLEIEGFSDPSRRRSTKPFVNGTAVPVAEFVWQARNQEAHWRSTKPLHKPVTEAFMAVDAGHPTIFGSQPLAREADLRQHSFAAEVCFEVLRWRNRGDALASLRAIT